jgi:hypothetical protein
MKKIIFLLLISFFLVGCNAEYTLTINEDNSSDEKVLIDNYSAYYDSVTASELIENTISSSNYSYDVDENELTILRHFDKYINLHDNSEISSYFGNIKVSDSEISFEPDYDKCLFLFSDGGEFVTNDTIKINVKIPFKVRNSNADKVSDYYTWEYGINDCKKVAYIEIGEGIISTWSIIFAIILVTITIVLIVLKKKKMRG